MASSKGSSRSPKSEGHTASGKTRVQWQGYVNVSVTEDMKNEYKASIKSGWDAGSYLEDVLAAGYKLSVTWDSYNQSYSASLYAQATDTPNSGWCLPIRASNPFEAISRLTYIHLVCLGGVWPVGGAGREPREW